MRGKEVYFQKEKKSTAKTDVNKKCYFEKKILEKKPEVLLPVLVQK